MTLHFRIKSRTLAILSVLLLSFLSFCTRPAISQINPDPFTYHFSNGGVCGSDLLDQPRPDLPMLFGRSTDMYNIPVVVHVVHSSADPIGVGSNYSDADVVAMIDDLNSRMENNGSGDVGIRYCFAEIDPNGDSTNGITRNTYTDEYEANGVSISGGPGEPDQNMKYDLHWDHFSYYNIYIVHKINGVAFGNGITGYAYFPFNNYRDGTVIRADRWQLGQTTLAHEIGHAFYLYHTHESTASCTSETDCATQGDLVCDTPPHPITWSCTPNCPSAPTTNYMCYSSCRIIYTSGQIDRMHNAIQQSSVRLSLISSNVCSYDSEPPDDPEQCNDACPNDICSNAQSYNLCDQQSFCNVNCNTEGDYDVLVHPASGVPCGGSTHYLDQWYSFQITEATYYQLTIGGEFISDLGISGNYGPFEGVMWQLAKANSCDSLEWVTSGTCLNNAAKCFCGPLGPSAWAGLCVDATCGNPMELQPYWWTLTPPDFPLDLDPPPGGYDPTRQSWDVLLPLNEGNYFLVLKSFTPGDGTGAFYPSYGGGTFSICPISGPLSTKPVLKKNGTTLSWEGDTQTEWTLFWYDGTIWEPILVTDEYSAKVDRTGLYRVYGTSGFSNIKYVEIQKQSEYEGRRFDATGRENNRFYIVR